MTYEDMGKVFQFLLKYREASADPFQRKRKHGEEDVSDILDSARDSNEIDGFNAFLAPQGFYLYIVNPVEIGRRPDHSCIYVLSRSDNDAAAYMEKDWFVKEMDYGRYYTTEKRDRLSCAIWSAYLWLELQQLLYVRLIPSRGVDELERCGEAVVTEQEFADYITKCIDDLRIAGKPEIESPIAFKILCDQSGDAEHRAKTFLSLMKEAGHLEEISSLKGDIGQPSTKAYRQTFLAAVEIKRAVKHGLFYLEPWLKDANRKATVNEIIKGAVL